MEKAESMCLQACIPQSWWEFSIEHATHVYNCTLMRHLNWQTPYTLLYEERPSVEHLRVFGCGAYVFLPVEVRANKLAPKSELMTYLGNAPGWTFDALKIGVELFGCVLWCVSEFRVRTRAQGCSSNFLFKLLVLPGFAFLPTTTSHNILPYHYPSSHKTLLTMSFDNNTLSVPQASTPTMVGV